MSAGGTPSVDPGAFAFAPERGAEPAAVLCLHGLSGTPYEVRAIGEACAARGLAALGPTLPGHGARAEDLAAIESYERWLDAARESALRLRARHDRVFAAGLSMGGLLALALAADELVDALCVVGTPLRLPAAVRMAVPLLRRLRPYVPKRGGSDIVDAAARARHPSLPVMPLRAVQELIRLQRTVTPLLPRVRAPILVAHGALDRTARPADAQTILRVVSSSEREWLACEGSGHVVPVDVDGPQLAEASATFFLRRLGSARSALTAARDAS
ncbi:MAG TPA: alpha/beta fold hydrolase [Myxococcota bacterium]|jgi:carboxylesterase|nr:alpha/beta fold hydrolase [Myxococcota bacterium]